MSDNSRIYRTEGARLKPCCWTDAKCPTHAPSPRRVRVRTGALAYHRVMAGDAR